MNFPCDCKEMVWMIRNNDVFRDQKSRWMLTWRELDKGDKKGVNIEQFGVVMHYCMFCGKKIIYD